MESSDDKKPRKSDAADPAIVQRQALPSLRDGLGVRLADLDLTRATEQTAIVLSLDAATYPKKRRDGGVSTLALEAALGFLAFAFCKGRIVHVDRRDKKRDAWKRFYWERPPLGGSGQREAKLFGISDQFINEERMRDGLAMDFVLSPIDGARAMAQARDTGTVCVLAGGPQGSFIVDPDFSKWKNYLVVASLPGKVFPAEPPSGVGAIGGNAQTFRETLLRSTLPLEQHQDSLVVSRELRAAKLIEDSLDWLRSTTKGHHVAWTTSTMDQPYSAGAIADVLRMNSRVRVFTGSSVAAAISVFLPTFALDMFAAIVRGTQVVQIAAAAHATGGELIAIPVRVRWGDALTEVKNANKKKGDAEPPRQVTVQKELDKREDEGQGPFFTIPNQKVYGKYDLVRSDDVFLTATGVTESLLLEGCRFPRDSIVRTHTLSMRSKTRSTRFITHHHDLTRKRFRFLRYPRDQKNPLRQVLDKLGCEAPGPLPQEPPVNNLSFLFLENFMDLAAD